MPLLTFAHSEQDVDRLVRALRDLVDEHGEPGSGTDVRPLPSRRELRTEQGDAAPRRLDTFRVVAD